MTRLSYLLVLELVLDGLGCAVTVQATDWPTYRHDNRRSGASTESLAAADLAMAWIYRSPQPPQPAWAGAADVDAFRKQRGLGDARDYDPAFHCVAAGERVFFGSSSDDAVHCLDLKSGKPNWTFTTGGPVRVAPAVAGELVHFGSDDGCAYAVDAASGELRWRFLPPCPQRRVLNDGRLISLWPCRTGVLVDEGTAYFAMSFLPWKPTFICAVDAATGRADGPGRFVRRVEEGLTLEAAMLASDSQLIAPQGRSGTVVLRRTTGEQVTALPGASTFAVLTEEEAFYSGPFSRDIGLRGTSATSQQGLAWHPWALAILAQGQDFYLLGQDGLTSTKHGAANEQRWSAPLKAAISLVMAGDTLFVGCDGEVVGIARQSGKTVWRASVKGKAHGLAVANGTLIVSTDEGCIYGFRAAETPSTKVPVAAIVPTQTENSPRTQFESKPGFAVPLAIAPYCQFDSPHEAIVRWQTQTPSPTLFQYSIEGVVKRFEDATPRTEHSAKLIGLRRNRKYAYEVRAVKDGQIGIGSGGNIDTFFNYSSQELPTDAAPYGQPSQDDPVVEAASRILNVSGATAGVCLVFTRGDGRLAWELARRSKLRVVVVEANPQRVQQLRHRWQSAGIYGSRLNVLQVETLEELPLPEMLANLIVDERLAGGGQPFADEQTLVRLLRPQGGAVWLGHHAASHDRFIAAGLKLETSDGPIGQSAVARRGKLAGSADWSHQYGSADNAGYTGETLAGCRAASDFEVQWIGRPGPRDHTDRQTRHPAPLCTGGRLLIQGQERIVALDAYNGSPLWSLELPGLERYDIPHDAGNWAADDEHAFVAIGGHCWQIASSSGTLVRRLAVLPGRKTNATYDWGYLALADNLLVGSANLQNANSKGWWGGEFWRDEDNNTITASDNLFAIDKRSGQTVWKYAEGILPNTAITVADSRVFFVESRDAKVIADYGGRVQLHDGWPDRYLVALDLTTGAKAWEVPLNIQGGQALFGMAWSDGKLVICSSGAGKYYVYAFDAAKGQPLWQQTVDWGGRGHGAQYSRPVIVQGAVFIRPFAMELATGKLLPARMPGGGCGTYCASRDALFFRSGDITAWSPTTDQLSGFSRLRPGCWLSAIPAAGLLLSPEAGGGCSCGGWMETSIAFAPAEFPPPSFKTRDRNFIDELPVELFGRIPGSVIRYTLDGKEPSEASPIYTKAVALVRTNTVKAATYFQRPDRPPARSTTVSVDFVRQYPSPAIPDEVTTFTDSLSVELNKRGKTGTVYYTLDGSEPTQKSTVYDGPIVLTSAADMATRTIWTFDDGQVAKSDVSRQRFYHVTKKLPREVSINFQHKGFRVPEGYLVDGGETFRPQPSGYFYGWTRDMRTRLASRGDVQDPLRNTFIHFMADTAWEIEVENGRYEVMVCVGETFYGQERATIYVEGIEFCKDLTLPRKETREITKTVEIKDGRITITSHEDNRVQKATRLNHLRIRRVE